MPILRWLVPAPESARIVEVYSAAIFPTRPNQFEMKLANPGLSRKELVQSPPFLIFGRWNYGSTILPHP